MSGTDARDLPAGGHDEETTDEPAHRDRRADRGRRRRLAAALDGALPDVTADERGDAWGEPTSDRRDDEWFRSQVPPHHG